MIPRRGRPSKLAPPEAETKADPPHRQVQQRHTTLTKLGYGPLRGDGLMGRGTRRALERFSWIMMRSATDLSKADLHVFSKLFDDGLERGQEAKAFSWRQIGGHDDVLDFFVGHLINVEMTRQPAP